LGVGGGNQISSFVSLAAIKDLRLKEADTVVASKATEVMFGSYA